MDPNAVPLEPRDDRIVLHLDDTSGELPGKPGSLLDRNGFPLETYSFDWAAAAVYAAENAFRHRSTDWKRHPNRHMRRAAVLLKRHLAARQGVRRRRA